MRGSAATMQVLSPKTPTEALRLFGRSTDAIPLAGGTDVMVGWNMGLLNHKTVLDLSRLGQWARVQKLKKGVAIGALVTHSQVQRHVLLRKRFPLLAQACATIGAAAIQNRGTIGGNIANASPAGDTFPALAVYEAIVRAAKHGASRELPVLEIFAGVKKTRLQPGELIESIEIPLLRRPPARMIFRKVGTRAAQALSKVVVAGLLWLRKDKTVEELRFAIGSVAPTVRRLKAAEDFVLGKKLTAEIIDEACALVARDIAPIDDIRSTAAYRMRISQNLLRSFLDGSFDSRK